MLSDCSFKGTKMQEFSQETERMKMNGAYHVLSGLPHPSCLLSTFLLETNIFCTMWYLTFSLFLFTCQ